MKYAKIAAVLSVLFLISMSVEAKMVHRWDPAALTQGKFRVQKTAYVVKEEPKQYGIEIESKHILVHVDYTGKIYPKYRAFARK